MTYTGGWPSGSSGRSAGTWEQQSDEEWALWREEALADLDPFEVFGPWLTGRTWESWLECADVFFRPDSGDVVRVADGSGLHATGTVVSSRSEQQLDVFTAMVCCELAEDIDDAERQIAEMVGLPRPSEG